MNKTLNDVQRFAKHLKLHDNGLVTSLNKTVGYIKNGRFSCCDKLQEEIFKNALRLQREAYVEDPKEQKFRDDLAQDLAKKGWKVSKEVYTSSGRIDILAERNHETMIIETKISSLSNPCSHALGQLLFYQNYYPDASLWLATPQKPNSTILSILSKNGVSYYE